MTFEELKKEIGSYIFVDYEQKDHATILIVKYIEKRFENTHDLVGSDDYHLIEKPKKEDLK